MTSIFKKIITCVVLIAVVGLLGAAKAPVGTVPQNEPLQPLPEYTKPNIEHSVNGPADHAAASEAENEQTNIAPNVNDETPPQMNALDTVAEEVPPTSSNFWIYAGLSVVLVGALGAFIIRRKIRNADSYDR